MIYAFVGSGGKTTSIFTLANHFVNQGKKVLITTTTHMYAPTSPLAPVLPFYCAKYSALSGSLDEIRSVLNAQNLCIAGLPSDTVPDKITALPKELYNSACSLADIVLVEADGSRGLPFKFPSENEPVIPENADSVFVMCSLSGLGRPLSSVCHRPETALRVLAENGFESTMDSPVLPEYPQLWLQKGYLYPLRRRFPQADIRICCTQAETLYERAIAALLENEQPVTLLSKEWFCPSPHLVLLGAGHISKALAQIACILDFQVTVIDDRPEFASSEYFPENTNVICSDFSEISDVLPREDGCYYAVLTRGHLWDRACVEAVLSHPNSYAYLGMIGSRTKVRATFDALLSEGCTKEQLDTIYAPIGLKIGGQTPAEIAVSIAAQLVQVRSTSRSFGSCSREFLEQTAVPGILAVITEKKGSAPRGSGSMMFLTTDGQQFGTIGGGAVELETLSRMQKMLDTDNFEHSNSVQICHFDVSAAESASLGMVCGGQITVILLSLNRHRHPLH